jgi:renalase
LCEYAFYMVQESLDIAVIGAGMAGLACADQLAAAGHRVTLLDKSRGPGGRMSTRRIDTACGEASFDHGAQYFTARDSEFQALVAEWQARGVVAIWPVAGPDAWVGTPAMNAPIKHMALAHTVIWSVKIDEIMGDQAGWRLVGENAPASIFDTIILAVPAEQAAPLLQPWDAKMAETARITKSHPCWTVLLAFAEPLPSIAKTLRDNDPIGWAACNSSKPGRAGPETWVIQASPSWSQQNLEEEAGFVVSAMTSALATGLDLAIPEPLIAQAHRWRYAKSGSARIEMLYNPAIALGVCGDWLLGPRIECAWLSGTALGKAIATASQSA